MFGTLLRADFYSQKALLFFFFFAPPSYATPIVKISHLNAALWTGLWYSVTYIQACFQIHFLHLSHVSPSCEQIKHNALGAGNCCWGLQWSPRRDTCFFLSRRSIEPPEGAGVLLPNSRTNFRRVYACTCVNVSKCTCHMFQHSHKGQNTRLKQYATALYERDFQWWVHMWGWLHCRVTPSHQWPSFRVECACQGLFRPSQTLR